MTLRIASLLAAILALAALAAVADEDRAVAVELFGSPYLRDFDDLRMIWIRQCSHAAVSDTDVGWVVDSGIESETVFLCLLAKTDRMELQQISNTDVSAVYLPPFNNGYPLRGPSSWKQPEAMIRTTTKVLIVSGGDTGIEGLLHVADDLFLVSVGFATHIKIYKLSAENHKAVYLTDGYTIDVEDPDIPTFRVGGRKSYFNKGGAFWFEAIIDDEGRIIDIPTAEGCNRLSTKDLQNRSGLDLSRVKRRYVCIAT